jgi:ABC-2 type transport system permease protein
MTSTAPLPSTLAVGLSRGRLELKQFFRQRDAVVFTFSLPVLLAVLLGLIDRGPVVPGGKVYGNQVLVASMIAYGIFSTAFTSVGVGIAVDREDGTLKRLHGMPVPATAYFLSKVVLIAVTTVAEVALLLAAGVLVFDLPLPTDPGRWWTFAWLLVLSVVSCTLLGVGASALARSARSAPAVLSLPVLVLQFTSGIFVSTDAVPDAMITGSSLFPVKWIGQGFRSVFLPDSMAAQEAAGGWEHGRTALVLAAWCVAGLVLSLATFRWTDRRAG